MFISLILIVLLGCQQHKSSPTVNAFRPSFTTASLSTTKKAFHSLASVKDDENTAYYFLLDESVLLYSQVSRIIDSESTAAKENDLETQRINELTSLIEDVVFKGIRESRDDAIQTTGFEEGHALKNIDVEEQKPTNLDEISWALDQQILHGLPSIVTDEELDQWVGRIDTLYGELQSHLTALPPADASTTTTTLDVNIPVTTTPTLDLLRVRLESMRSVIDPSGKAR